MAIRESLKLAGVMHDFTLFEVTETDEQGRPKTLRIIWEDDKVVVRTGLRFLSAYVPRKALVVRTGRD